MDDKDLTPRITLTNDTTSINVSPTRQRFKLRWQLKKGKKNLNSFTQTAWTRWRSFSSADSLVEEKGCLKSWDKEKVLIYVWFTWTPLRFNSLLGRHENGRHWRDGGSAQAITKCFFNGAVRCNPKFISSFNVWCRGQDAASEAHHCRNTNVSGKAQKN